ncbi:phosphotransferase [Myceligenerans salitolerans]|uniref:Phosphotransferase n=1 Tax=Myceligenerans salitolerans TaxID=1230528 RepID=A0ABS3IDL4_9MICO|nr:phosphotransferase [Myceligenerans salitolerans]MBO0610696.1 phosphotransferase [Myceligenerans salitolerans]
MTLTTGTRMRSARGSAGSTDRPWHEVRRTDYSVVERSAGGSEFRKTYLRVRTTARLHAERAGITAARRVGLETPAIAQAGSSRTDSWIVLAAIPGESLSASSAEDLTEFVRVVRDVSLALDRIPCAGAGWAPSSTRLLTPCAPSFQGRPWFPTLAEYLDKIDRLPVAALHGDLKPEHLIVGPARYAVIDWEGFDVGPVAVDHAHAAFHAVRDALLSELDPAVLAPLEDLNLVGPVLAWRLALWLDRRRPGDLGLLDITTVECLCRARTPTESLDAFIDTLGTLLAAGVPR